MADAQSGHEKTITSLLPALAGANLIYGLGMLESGVTIDYAQLVMDAEFARMVKFCVPGIPVTDATLSVDVIGEIGPFKDFLSHEDTYAGMRGQSSSKLIDRRVREEWTAAGSTTRRGGPAHPRDAPAGAAPSTTARSPRPGASSKTHRPEPLPEAVADEISAIVQEAEATSLGVGG